MDSICVYICDCFESIHLDIVFANLELGIHTILTWKIRKKIMQISFHQICFIQMKRKTHDM